MAVCLASMAMVASVSWSPITLHAGGGLSIVVSSSKNLGVDYVVQVDSQPWLRSASTGVTHSSKTFFSNATACGNTCLIPDPAGPTNVSGTDKELGNFVGVSLRWTTSSFANSDFVFVTTFKAFTHWPILVFEQAYPGGAEGTRPSSGKGSDKERLGSFFPSWSRASTDTVSSLQTFAGTGQEGVAGGPWPTAHYNGGVRGGAPLVIYRPERQNGRTVAPRAVVMSPLDNFMASVHVFAHFGVDLAIVYEVRATWWRAWSPVEDRYAVVVFFGGCFCRGGNGSDWVGGVEDKLECKDKAMVTLRICHTHMNLLQLLPIMISFDHIPTRQRVSPPPSPTP